MPWWGWILVGVVLLGSEALTDAGFYLAILGVAALFTGLGAAFGLLGPLYVEWAVFGALSIVLLLGVRRQLYGWVHDGSAPGYEALIGEVATVSETIDPGALGHARLRGADWTARNVGPSVLTAGHRARIERVEQLVLSLRAEE